MDHGLYLRRNIPLRLITDVCTQDDLWPQQSSKPGVFLSTQIPPVVFHMVTDFVWSRFDLNLKQVQAKCKSTNTVLSGVMRQTHCWGPVVTNYLHSSVLCLSGSCNIKCYTRFIVYKGKVWTWMLLFVLIRSASVKTWHEPNTTNICSSRGMLHIDRKTFLNLLGWPGIKGKHSTCVLVWLHRSFALLGRWMILEAIQCRHGVMVWNETVLRDLEICPQWGLVWLCEWCNGCPRVTTTQDGRKVWVFCF